MIGFAKSATMGLLETLKNIIAAILDEPKYLKFWKVNFFDWLWYVFYMQCNEFHYKLNLYSFCESCNHKTLQLRIERLSKLRHKAHIIDMKLTGE